MRQIELRTRDGQHVANVEISPFVSGPDVVVWGERTFVAKAPFDPAPVDVFFEAFAAMSLTPSPGL